MSKKEIENSNLQAKRGSTASGDRRKSGTSGDGETGGERRVSRGSGGSAEALNQQQKKVLFSEAATAKDSKRLSQSPTGPILEHQPSQDEVDSPKSQKKSAISTWRAACGMTKDKTKDLLKRWRTLPDQDPKDRPPLQEIKSNTTGDHNWSVHVWATWVKRCPSDDDTCDLDKEKAKKCENLTDTQKEKLSYFFAHVFDMDRDDIIALQDFEGFTEEEKTCSRRLKFELKSINDLVAENTGLQASLNDMQVECALSDDSASAHSAAAVLELLRNPKPDIARRIMQEELKLSGESTWDRAGQNNFYGSDCGTSYGLNIGAVQAASQGNGIQRFPVCWLGNDWLVFPKDLRICSDRLRHFAEWSSNCGEYLILQQVQQGLIETFIYPLKQDADSSEGAENPNRVPKDLDRLFLGMDEWLVMWGDILGTKKSFYDLPLWLQFLPKVMFAAINKSGTGRITKEELGSFYSSVMGYPAKNHNDLLNEAYTAMTAGGDFQLTYDCYRLCFANFLFGRHPNGPGQYIFGAAQRSPPPLFPIDYSAMNSSQEDIEPYDGSLKSNRSSVIV